MKLRKGSQDARGLTVGIVASKFNQFVTSRLLTECVKALTKAGASDEAIEVVRVPGAFEIPSWPASSPGQVDSMRSSVSAPSFEATPPF